MDPFREHEAVEAADDGGEQLRYEKRDPADVRRLLGALVSARALVTAQIVPDETTTVQRWLTTRGPLNYAHVVLLTLRQEQQDVQTADGGAVTVLRTGRLDREGGVFLAL